MAGFVGVAAVSLAACIIVWSFMPETRSATPAESTVSIRRKDVRKGLGK
jgi:hypothetical protein